MENLDEALSVAEQEAQGYGDAFEIIVQRKTTGMKATMQVYAMNTLEQVLTGAADLIKVNVEKKILIFENASTQKSTTDRTLTIAEMGLQKGDTLCISEDGPVAAC
ncbi:MAG: hypothetical protein ABFC31_09290 [Clostridiaceae bacterium]